MSQRENRQKRKMWERGHGERRREPEESGNKREEGKIKRGSD